ncbi:DET1- and DDB1-associated protein 1-like [Phytophthora palmivora]|uniref:DET1-and DDB1-associated protein 1-like n=1 Tax=Phytophthora palmivora TaxID=4796 RepID=A0A2P4Y0H2_9STRA|nr:DET1- and DDB1-associated protein 1-like [Phytophthora palmivora]
MRADTMEEKAPAMTVMAAWPTSSAANFTKLPQESGGKMIVTPKAYYATHDTMPPPNQVIMMTSTQSFMKELYQAADRKVAGKRGNGGHTSPRPPKHHRICE